MNPVSLVEPTVSGAPQWSDSAYGGNSAGDRCGDAYAAPAFDTVTGVLWEPSGAWVDLGALFKPPFQFQSKQSRVRSVSERDSIGNLIACGDNSEVSSWDPPGAFVWWTDPSPAFRFVTASSGVNYYGADFNDGSLEISYEPGTSAGCFGCPKLSGLRDVNSRGWMVGTTSLSEHVPSSAVLVLPAPCQSDLNNDGLVNAVDMTILLSAWGSCPSAGYCLGDRNADGQVSSPDFTYLLSEWTGEDLTLCALAALCDANGGFAGCRGTPQSERLIAQEVLAVISRYGCMCCGELECFLEAQSDSTRLEVIEEIQVELGGVE